MFLRCSYSLLLRKLSLVRKSDNGPLIFFSQKQFLVACVLFWANAFSWLKTIWQKLLGLWMWMLKNTLRWRFIFLLHFYTFYQQNNAHIFRNPCQLMETKIDWQVLGNRNPTEIHLQLTAGKGAANSFKSIGKGVRKGACWWGMLVLETVLKGGQGFQTRSKESINGSTKNSTSFGNPQRARPWVLSTHGRWTPPSLLWWVENLWRRIDRK